MTSENIGMVRHIPFLRRYARTLVGSQERGDTYVRVCLEALLAEPIGIENDRESRLHLYRLFHAIWAPIAERADRDEGATGAPAERLQSQILHLPPHERQVLLLTAIEGFSVAEVAEILSIDAARAEELLRQARRHIAAQSATDVLVIEDEPVIAFDIIGIVSEMGHRVVGTATTKGEAIVLAKAKRPGIVLADIQLRDHSSGIDAVAEILETLDVPVIFITAYPERLLTGQRREPTYLVTKPFEPDTLKVTIYQALLSHEGSNELKAAG